MLLLLVAFYYLFLRSDHSATADRKGKADSTGSPTQVLSRTADTNAEAGEGTTAAPPPAGGDSLTLEGKATSKIWFAIVMDGKRSETGTLDSGSVKVWRATQHFKLSLGNAGGLQLSLNDKSIGTLGPARTSVRNQIIDASGVRRLSPPHKPAAEAAVPDASHPTVSHPATSHPATQRRSTRQGRGTTLPRIITPTEPRTAPPPR